jgi:flavin-dependent dehydrogenase
VEVTTKTQKYRSRLVIGADGASGITATTMGLRDNIWPGLAWEAEISAERSDILRYSQTVFLDWGTFPGGYGWVFPKKDHFSIGVGGPAYLSKWMMPYYDRFIQTTGIQFRETLSLKSWPIPVRVRKSCFHKDFVMVAGDAAGLTDPLTGEGIYYAVRSGKMAAEACCRFMTGRVHDLAGYTGDINRELMDELIEAARIKDIFNSGPLRIHEFVRDSDRAWGAFCKILRGERKYGDVRKGFGSWKNFWIPVTYAAKIRAKNSEQKFIKKGLVKSPF